MAELSGPRPSSAPLPPPKPTWAPPARTLSTWDYKSQRAAEPCLQPQVTGGAHAHTPRAAPGLGRVRFPAAIGRALATPRAAVGPRRVGGVRSAPWRLPRPSPRLSFFLSSGSARFPPPGLGSCPPQPAPLLGAPAACAEGGGSMLSPQRAVAAASRGAGEAPDSPAGLAAIPAVAPRTPPAPSFLGQGLGPNARPSPTSGGPGPLAGIGMARAAPGSAWPPSGLGPVPGQAAWLPWAPPRLPRGPGGGLLSAVVRPRCVRPWAGRLLPWSPWGSRAALGGVNGAGLEACVRGGGFLRTAVFSKDGFQPR